MTIELGSTVPFVLAPIASEVSIPAALIADRARSTMLLRLTTADALAAADLARVAGVSPATASVHLGKLVRGGLVSMQRTGRYAFYRLSGPAVARALEALAAVAPRDLQRVQPAGPSEDPLRFGRMCYDHLAGQLGVGLTDALLHDRKISKLPNGYGLTKQGVAFLREIGIDSGELRARPRAFARPCLDRTERRPHLGGALGAGLAERCFARGWTRAGGRTRTVRVTAAGKTAFRTLFGLEL